MLKKGMLGAAFALLVAGAGAFAQKQQVMLDKVVAVVGSSSILHSEVAEYARQLTPSAVPKDIPPTVIR